MNRGNLFNRQRLHESGLPRCIQSKYNCSKVSGFTYFRLIYWNHKLSPRIKIVMLSEASLPRQDRGGNRDSSLRSE